MIDGLVTLLKAQNFTGIQGVYGVIIPQGKPVPAILVDRIGTDPYESLDGSVSLEQADVDIDVYANDPGDAITAAREIKAFFRNYTGPMGNHQCESVLYLNESEGYEKLSDGSPGRFIHSLTFQVEFVEATP